MGRCRSCLPRRLLATTGATDLARRTGRAPRRKEATREPYDRVLIVTEGTKTEPAYSRELVACYRLNTANVEVVPSDGGSDPGTVLETATELRDGEERLGNPYDRVYCVFDRDEHANFDSASVQAGARKIRLARSWPCFEYWLLLHFEYTRAPFTAVGGRSSCDSCVGELRRHLPDYGKAMPGVFERLAAQLDMAKSHARRALSDAASDDEPNPSTEIHELVEYLQALKG